MKNRIVACFAAYNEEKMLPYSLHALGDVVDSFIVVEGGVQGYTESFRSTDLTNDIISDFAKSHDVKHIQSGRLWKSLEEQKNVFTTVARQGDWLLIVDADEMHDPKSIMKMREKIDSFDLSNSNITTEYTPVFLEFYMDYNHVVRPFPNTIRRINEDPVLHHNFNAQRFFKFQNGVHYSCHHPCACDRFHVNTYLQEPYMSRRIIEQDWYVYHLGLVRSFDRIAHKYSFYYNRLFNVPQDQAYERAVKTLKSKEFQDLIYDYNDGMPVSVPDLDQKEQVATVGKDWKEIEEYKNKSVPKLVDGVSGKIWL